MAQLIVRNIEKDVVVEIKRRAAKQGVSMEEELRRILRKSVGRKLARTKKDTLWEYLLTMPNVGRDSDFRIPRRGKMREVNLSD